ncbi:helix-turn-helix domain-containing protein [Tenacibaculum sp. S7007]|uniref:Helix-turn-helix domain-containing protein n=1 Tax=Tenacibaculum pelagium TaxID=2759527 RepID=A0A839AKQ3_9FLAO|nr:helix-turn-helix domain-containing protein [Tenacibaculum pelagium]MBA6155683.1 helix-turn-helix domain-containing protein [Tenacibaculum pelagium]
MVQHITNDKTAINLAVTYYLNQKSKFHRKCIEYWVDNKKNSVFYLIRAINKKAIIQLYFNFFKLYPYKISSVNNDLVNAFLNSQQKIKSVQTESLEVKTYPVFLIVKTLNKSLLEYKIGLEKSSKLLLDKKKDLNNYINSYNGIKIDSSEENNNIAEFTSCQKAIRCAYLIQKKLLRKYSNINFRIALFSEPNNYKEQILSQKIPKLLNFLFFLCNQNELLISSNINHSYSNNGLKTRKLNIQQENFLFSLAATLDKNYHNSKFNIPDFCKSIMMSKTKLYRNCKSLTGMSINALLKEYRLKSSLNSLNKNHSSISQISINSGFSSSSYFSNCFKKKFGISPRELALSSNLAF